MKRKSNISEYLKQKQSVLVLGPRGTGKTWYLNQLLDEFNRKLKIDLLSDEEYLRYASRPDDLYREIGFKLKTEPDLVVFIDEIQRLPVLLNEVQRLMSDFPGRCQFVLTGSSARKLRKSQANLLAGRALYTQFFPLNGSEIPFADELPRALQFGTLPAAWLAPSSEIASSYLRTYTQVYLKEEIIHEAVSRNIQVFSRFLDLAAAANGQPVNYLGIARQTGTSDKTIRSHYQILEDTLLAACIPAWSASIRTRLQRSPKYYFFDTGLLNALTGELRSELREGTYRFGRLFESLVVNEIIRYNVLHGLGWSISHYRTQSGSEIDLILQRTHSSPPVAVEIKSSARPVIAELRALRDLGAEISGARLVVICRCRSPWEEGGIEFLPFPEGLSEVFREKG